MSRLEYTVSAPCKGFASVCSSHASLSVVLSESGLSVRPTLALTCRWKRERSGGADAGGSQVQHVVRRGNGSRHGPATVASSLARLAGALLEAHPYDRARRIAAIVSAYSWSDNTFGACVCSQIGRRGFGSQL